MSGFLNTLKSLWESFNAILPPGAVATAAILITLLVALAIWRHIT